MGGSESDEKKTVGPNEVPLEVWNNFDYVGIRCLTDF